MSEQFMLARDAAELIHADIRAWGEHRVETGAFLLADAASGVADIVALAGESGVTRRADCFRLSGGAIERLFSWAGDRGMRIVVQVHSHRRAGFLSQVDLDHGFSVEGFVSSVVPNYAAPPRDPGEWAWWRFSAGAWTQILAPATIPHQARIVTFDAKDISER